MTLVPPRKLRVLVNSASGIGTVLVNVIFVFWLYQYLLARVPAEEFAIYPLISMLLLLVPFIISSYASALSRSVITAYSEGRPDEVMRSHSSLVFALMGFVAVLLLVGSIGAMHIDWFLSIDPEMLGKAKIMALLVLIELSLTVFVVPFTIAYEVRQVFFLRDAINVGLNLLKICLTFAFLFGVSTSVVWVPLASCLTAGAGAVINIIVAQRILPEFRPSLHRFSLAAVRDMLSFGFWTTLGGVALFIHQGAAIFLLNLFGTPQQVNGFFIGTIFERRMTSVMGMALAPIQPVMVAMAAQGNLPQLGKTYARGGRYALWLSMAIGTPGIVYAQEFITLYLGPDHAATGQVMQIMFLTFPFAYASGLLSRVVIALGELRSFFLHAVLSGLAIAAGVFLVLTLTDYGLLGVALAVLAVHIIWQLGVFWPMGLKLTGLRWSEFLRDTVVKGLLPSLGGLCIWLPLKYAGLADGWAGFLSCGFVGGLAYCATVALFCLTREERSQLSARVRARRAT